ncbi:hypothetical protein BVRB_4g080710 [Beta vulgaris subsp. vulgaris]|nr:hypothetical protein BVRB_4g080710 [Beta vulgaris subsp. vulgaris]
MGALPIEHIAQDSATKIKHETSKSHVTLKVNGGDDHDVYYRVKRDFPLHHLKLDYCNRLCFDYGTVRFTYRKAELSGTKTPDDLQMEDGCVIDTWVDKVGG